MKHQFRIFAVLLLIAGAAVTAHSGNYNINTPQATCKGETPCKACKNCKYCKRCSQEGKKCGVCKKPRTSDKTIIRSR